MTTAAHVAGYVADVLDINPDFDAPWLSGLRLVVSYVLATALILAFLALIVALIALLTRWLFPSQVRDWAVKNILVVVMATVLLTGVGVLFAFFVNFDFGF